MKAKTTDGLLISGLIALAGVASAQGRRDSPRYDPANEVSIHGTVDEVLTVQPRYLPGIHLRVKTDGKLFEVRLGPSWFLEQQHFAFSKGDQIDVTDAATPDKNGQVVIAREVKRGDRILVLRDPKGYPAWSRGALRPS